VAAVNATGRDDRPPDQAVVLQWLERFVVALPDRPASLSDLVDVLQLAPEEGCGYLAEQI
jgi:hypothetical protein